MGIENLIAEFKKKAISDIGCSNTEVIEKYSIVYKRISEHHEFLSKLSTNKASNLNRLLIEYLQISDKIFHSGYSTQQQYKNLEEKLTDLYNFVDDIKLN